MKTSTRKRAMVVGGMILLSLWIGTLGWVWKAAQSPGSTAWVSSHNDFRMGRKRFELLGCTRTNHVVSLDLGWWTLQHWKQGGSLPAASPKP